MDAQVLVIGSTMMDLIAYTPSLPKIGETISGSSFQTSFGGKGANQTVQCARMGTKTSIFTAVADDSYGDSYVKALSKEGVDVSSVLVHSGGSTGVASIWVDEEGHNSIVIIPGANLALSHTYVMEKLTNYQHLQVILFQNEILFETNKLTMTAIKSSSHGQKRPTILYNPAPFTAQCIEVIPNCDILCVNEVELQMLLQSTTTETTNLATESIENITTRCQSLLTQEGPSSIIVTLGERGAVLVTNTQQSCHYPAPTRKAIDTVGAGDAFLGCFAAYLAQGEEMQVCMQMAISAASYSVQFKGAQPSYATKEELLKFHAEISRNVK